MTQSWLCGLGPLAGLLILILLIVLIGVWCRRLNRRVRLLEVAARHSHAERVAIPEPLEDPAIDVTLPRFIGSPYPSRRGP